MAKFAVILPAAGKSSRFHDQHYKKPFAPLEGKAVWLHSAEKFLARNDVVQVIVVVSPEDRETFVDKFGANLAILGVDLVDGGRERADSVRNALEHVREQADFVAVHDAARPVIANGWIDQVFAAAEQQGAAILALPVTSTLKYSTDGKTIEKTVPREKLWAAQTPQVFRRQLLIDAYAQGNASAATDEAQLVESLGHSVALVPGSPLNLKITSKADLHAARFLLQALPKPKLFGGGNPFADDDLWR
jgi:2-C-methyl-D-erythritol 4-phosphate cytidylyltransferase